MNRLINSVLETHNLTSYEIVLFRPSLMFKLYLYILRMYIDKDLWNKITYLESFDELNEKFDFELTIEHIHEKAKTKKRISFDNIQIHKEESPDTVLKSKIREKENTKNILDKEISNSNL
jgi:hypothetical protein